MSFFEPEARRRFNQQSSPSPSLQNLISNSNRSSNTNSFNSFSPYNVSPNVSRSPSLAPLMHPKFSLAADPTSWGTNISPDVPEPDDYLHDPDPRLDRNDHSWDVCSYRGVTNVGCLVILITGILALFAGYPIASHFTNQSTTTTTSANTVNSTGQVASMGNFGLIDADTPTDAYTKTSYYDSSVELQLVFSDEFNVDGRSFYSGDDPYWEAVDLHYWQTNDLEWYDPEAITTANGSLVITLSEKSTHGLDYEGGHLSTWNKFCFTGGLLEASVMLPGTNDVMGLWPAVWAMGNLGRAGYGASLDGMWPYTYDSCDVGTAPNQTYEGLPLAATTDGDSSYGGVLSYLPGQRLSRCTCSGESHPGPVHSDGTYVGRSAPEIDVFEAQISGDPVTGQVSQSAQFAPFNAYYEWFNTTDNLIINNATGSWENTYLGGVYQQATSVVTETDQNCYELTGACYSTYGFEYSPGFDTSYITWISNGTAAWTIKAAGLAADSRVNISARPIPQEPMYIIANLGMSENFGTVDFADLTFPTKLRIDWIRVYQEADTINIGCDPADFPTAAYIAEYSDAYTNPNLTTWVDDYNQTFPKNSFLDEC